VRDVRPTCRRSPFCGSHQLLGVIFNHGLRNLSRIEDEPLRALHPGEADLSPGCARGTVHGVWLLPGPPRRGRSAVCRSAGPDGGPGESHQCEVKTLPTEFVLLANQRELPASRRCATARACSTAPSSIPRRTRSRISMGALSCAASSASRGYRFPDADRRGFNPQGEHDETLNVQERGYASPVSVPGINFGRPGARPGAARHRCQIW